MEILEEFLRLLEIVPLSAIGGYLCYLFWDGGHDQTIKDLMRHTYNIGETGTGKSTKCINDILDIIKKGYGCLYIDVHGKDSVELLNGIPPEHVDRVIYIDPADLSGVIGFPIFEGEDELAVDELISIFDILWPGFIGPSTEDILRMAALAVVPIKGSLFEIYRMLIDENYREKIYIEDEAVREFWKETFPVAFKKDKSRLNPPMNKLRKLIMSKSCRLTLCQSRPKFDLMKEMKKNKVIVCNFAKGKIGHDTSRLFAALMVAKVQMCTFQRSEKSTPFFLFLDEFQNYVTKSFPEILSESRKYNISLNLYHQYANQLPPQLYHAVRGNVGSRYAFRVDDDARLVAEMFDIKPEDIKNLENYTCYAKRLIDGKKEKTAQVIQCPPPPEAYGHAEEIMRRSKRIYGVSPDEIMADIKSRTKAANTLEDEIL